MMMVREEGNIPTLALLFSHILINSMGDVPVFMTDLVSKLYENMNDHKFYFN